MTVKETLEKLGGEGYQRVTGKQVGELYRLLLGLSGGKLSKLANDPENPILVRIVSKKILGAKSLGDIDKILDRAFGKGDWGKVGESGGLEIVFIDKWDKEPYTSEKEVIEKFNLKEGKRV